MNFKIDAFNLFKDEFEKQKIHCESLNFYKYAKPLIEDAYHVFLLTSNCVQYIPNPFNDIKVTPLDFHDYIKNNDQHEAKLMINRWFIELHDKEQFDSTKKYKSFKLAEQANQYFPRTTNQKHYIAQDKILEFFLLIKEAFKIFEAELLKAYCSNLSLNAIIKSYCNFIKHNPDFFELILTAKTENAQNLALRYFKKD